MDWATVGGDIRRTPTYDEVMAMRRLTILATLASCGGGDSNTTECSSDWGGVIDFPTVSCELTCERPPSNADLPACRGSNAAVGFGVDCLAGDVFEDADGRIGCCMPIADDPDAPPPELVVTVRFFECEP
jgi:hypothetical protein